MDAPRTVPAASELRIQEIPPESMPADPAETDTIPAAAAAPAPSFSCPGCRNLDGQVPPHKPACPNATLGCLGCVDGEYTQSTACTQAYLRADVIAANLPGKLPYEPGYVPEPLRAHSACRYGPSSNFV
jgi:hypothetical protein